MKSEVPALERKLERLIDTAWRSIRDFGKYMASRPKNKWELMDKRFLMLEISAFTFLIVSVLKAG